MADNGKKEGISLNGLVFVENMSDEEAYKLAKEDMKAGRSGKTGYERMNENDLLEMRIKQGYRLVGGTPEYVKRYGDMFGKLQSNGEV